MTADRRPTSGPRVSRRDEIGAPDPVRMASFGVLLRASTRHTSIDGALRAAAESFGDRDRRFLWNLTQETIRWQSRLDAVVAPLLHRPIEHLDPPLRVLLRLLACQACVLQQVPDHAIVNEGVRLAHRFVTPGAAKLVNAVGRRLVADGKARWEHIGSLDSPNDWPMIYSHPAWLVERWRRQWGDALTLMMLRWNNERPPIWLRARPGGRPPEGEAGWVPDTYRMPDGYRPSNDPAFAEGDWTVQDPSEALVVLLSPEDTKGTVLDLCAAPGTKTTHLTVRHPGARIVALDRTPARVSRLRETLRRTKEDAAILLGDATVPPLRTGTFSGVLVDAPCSALGVLRRRVDARWNVTPRDLRKRASTQTRILTAAASLVRPGGWLLYSVCSIEFEETDAMRQWFLDRFPRFRPIESPGVLPEALRVDRGTVRILPGQHECDGVYACLFERSGDGDR